MITELPAWFEPVVLWTVRISTGLGIFIFATAALVTYVRDRNYRKLVKLAGGRFDNESTETPDMSETKKPTDHHEHTILSAGAVPIFAGGCNCEVDPGIAPLVNLLKEHGFNSTDSGDGKSKPPEHRAFDFPHVFVMTQKDVLLSETDRLYQLLQSQGITGFTVEGNYGPADDVSMIMVLGKDEAELAQAVGEVTAPAEPAVAVAAPEVEALRQSAAIER